MNGEGCQGSDGTRPALVASHFRLDRTRPLRYGHVGMRGIDRLRLLITTALLGTHVLLSALVLASPPDPLAQTGIFDDDDGDDVVLQVMAMTAVVPPPPPDGGPIHAVVWLAPSHDLVSSPAVPLHARPIRAPPAS